MIDANAPASSSKRPTRDVVSFVRRSARMNDSQRKAWTKHYDTYVVDVAQGTTSTSISPSASVNWPAEFGRNAQLIVEIGSGIGTSLVPMAAHHRDHNIVAFEVFSPAVAQTMAALAREQIPNVRLVIADGAQGVTSLFSDASISQLWTFFADPWHKKRHHKRRLINPGFVTSATSKLAPGGRWYLATDWADYATHMMDVLSHCSGLRNVYDGFAPRLATRPLTKFEKRGQEAGRDVFDLAFERS